jgi:hypothetical protein
VTQILGTSRCHRCAEHTRGAAAARDVEGDVTVERLNDAVGTDALVIRILRGAHDLEARATVREIVDTFVVADLPHVGLQSELVVAKRLPDVQIVPATLHDQRLHGKNTIAASECGGRVGDNLLPGGLRVESRCEQHGREREAQRSVSHTFPRFSAGTPATYP